VPTTAMIAANAVSISEVQQAPHLLSKMRRPAT
jgi:hypothetical protein